MSPTTTTTMSSNSPQFLSRFKQTTQSLTANRRPWSVFLDLTSFNLPSSISDTTTRITQNLTYFHINYFLVVFLILCLSLIHHPVSLIALSITVLAWVFLYFFNNEEWGPLRVFGYEVSDWIVLIALFAATVLVFVWSGWGVFWSVLASVGIGVVLVGLHAVLRSTDDLVIEGDGEGFDTYENLLSDEEIASAPRFAL